MELNYRFVSPSGFLTHTAYYSTCTDLPALGQLNLWQSITNSLFPFVIPPICEHSYESHTPTKTVCLSFLQWTAVAVSKFSEPLFVELLKINCFSTGSKIRCVYVQSLDLHVELKSYNERPAIAMESPPNNRISHGWISCKDLIELMANIWRVNQEAPHHWIEGENLSIVTFSPTQPMIICERRICINLLSWALSQNGIVKFIIHQTILLMECQVEKRVKSIISNGLNAIRV